MTHLPGAHDSQPSDTLGSERERATKGFFFGPAGKAVYVLTSAIDEANASPRGWALLHDVEVQERDARWTVWEVDYETRTRRPVALLGYRRRTPGREVLFEIVNAVANRERRDDKLYRLADLVSSREIATMFGVTRDAVRQWCCRRGQIGFPEPLMRHPQLWDRREVLDWARATGRAVPNRRIGSGAKGVPKAVKDPRMMPYAHRPAVESPGR
jgi:hypothetical protein